MLRHLCCHFSFWNFIFCCFQKATKHCLFNRKRTVLASRQTDRQCNEYGSGREASWTYFFLPLPHSFFGYKLPFPDTFLRLCNVSKEAPLWKKMKAMLARICWLLILARYEIHEGHSQCLLITQINTRMVFCCLSLYI